MILRHPYSILFLLIVLGSCAENDIQTLSFDLLTEEQTRINFENTIIENDSINLFDYYYIYNGAGVGAGDLNNDGLPDLYFCGNMVSSKLFLNNGDMAFNDLTIESNVATDDWVLGVTMVDINADQWLDIYLSVGGPSHKHQATPNLLFVNQGLNDEGVPVFEEAASQYGIADPSFSVQSAFFDYDLDGDLDMIILTNQIDDINKTSVVKNGKAITQGATIDRLYENKGFIDSLGHPYYELRDTSSGISFEGYGLGLAIDDLNQDGYPDVYIANDFLPDEKIYINQGGGKFEERARDFLPTQSYNGMGVDIADINNDLLPDIMVLDMLPGNNDRRKSMIASMNPKGFNLREQENYQAQYVRNTLQLNRGTDNLDNLYFSEIGQLAGVNATDWSWAPLLADFDNDGYRDLFVANGFVKDMTDLDYINYSSSKSYFGTKEAKTDREKRMMDALTEVKINNVLYQNLGNLKFKDVTFEAGMTVPSFSNGSVYTDLDLDGDLDLVTNDINGPALIYENRSTSNNNYLKIKLQGTGLNKQGIGASIIAKSESKQLYHYHTTTKGYLSCINGEIHLGIGIDTLLQSVTVTWPDGQQQVMTDVACNQILEMTYSPQVKPSSESAITINPIFQETDQLIPYIHEENLYHDFDKDPLLLKKYSAEGPCISVGNIDGKHGDDLFIGGSHGHNPILFVQDKDGHFYRKTFLEGETEYEDVASLLFDFDKDGDEDLYVVSGGNEFGATAPNYQDRLYINDGLGQFSKSDKLPTISSSGSCVQGADFDKDGDIDLFVGGRISPGQYPLSPKSYLLENNGIQFEDVSASVSGLSTVGMVSSALWSDIDQDGWIDLILVGEWMPLTIFRNNNGVLQKMNEASLHSEGWWNVIKQGDFDNDGDLDLVAGNMGENQDYKASEEYPFVIFADDFDNNKKVDPIFASYMRSHANGIKKMYPFHGKDDLSSQIVAFKRIYPSYQEYSESTIQEVLSQESIDGSVKLSAYTFSSSLFINEGNGKFERRDLPIQAQFAPVYSIIVEDVNQDGNVDLILAGNHNNFEHTYGAQNVSLGVCLLGNGNNEFRALTPQESGLYLNKDVSFMTTIRTNANESILVAAVNSGKVVTLKKTNPKN